MKASLYKVAQIFAEAGFLEESHFRKMLQAAGKSLTDILFSDFSGRSVRDLMTFEIPLPFTKSKRDQMNAELRRDLSLSSEELRSLLLMYPERVTEVCQILEDGGLLWPDTTQQVRDGIAANAEAQIDSMLSDMQITVETLATHIRRGSATAQASRQRRAARLMVFNSIVTEDAMERIFAAHESGDAELSVLLASLGGVDQDDLIQALRGDLSFPRVNLTSTQISEEALEALPSALIRRHLILPFDRSDTEIHVAMSDPLDTSLTDALELLTGLDFTTHFAGQRDLIAGLSAAVPGDDGTAPGVPLEEEAAQVDPFEGRGAQSPEHGDDAETLVDNVSTVELVSTILESAFATHATDIHVEPLANEVRVRYRIDGHLKTILQFPREMLLPVISRIKVLSDLNVTERRRPQDGHFSLDLGTDAIDLRVSILPTHTGEKAVIRVLDEANVVRGLGDLGMPDPERERVAQLITRPHGLLLVVGPTGSGKTTTLYACLNRLNSEDRNIVTIEDPVEYRIAGINQIQIDLKIDLTFATGLRATLRQDPDIIMVGEIRDAETAKIAVRSALTGHLVLSTLHANSSPGSVSALRHMGVPAFSVANSLIGVISQRLVRRLCPACRETFVPKKALRADLGLPPASRRQLHRPVGCERCLDTGYRGRVGIFEAWEITAGMREVVLSDGPEREITEVAKAGEMSTLFENAHQMMREGVTSPGEVLRSVSLD